MSRLYLTDKYHWWVHVYGGIYTLGVIIEGYL